MIYLTSDCHGDFLYIKDYIKENNLSINDTIIILGDAGLYFNKNAQEEKLREEVNNLGVNFLILHGNKEERVSHYKEYKLSKKYSGDIYVCEQYPNLYFAADGELYNIENKTILTIGGACSLFAYCSKDGDGYWKDEIPNIKILKEKVICKDVDYILSHTSPLSDRPSNIFADKVDESLIDFSLEKYFDFLKQSIIYKKWYCGHYHIRQDSEKYRIIYKEIVPLK